MKIALIGGTFNPVHSGHLRIARIALESLKLDQVLWVPCAASPHKSNDDLAPAHHRLAMLELAIRDEPRFKISTIEIERGGISYTVDTLTRLRREFPDDEIYFLIGSDNFQEIGLWKRFPRLVELCEFLVVARPGFPIRIPPPTVPAELLPRLRHRTLDGAAMDVASSEVRRMLREGKKVSHLIPRSVYSYIHENALYLSCCMTPIQTARLCARSAENKKGEDILAFDLRAVSSVADFFVIVTGQSEPHLKAIRNEIEARLKEKGVTARGIDGYPLSQWVVMDYNEVIVHIFSKERREFYDLERLWGDAAHLNWQTT